jgi:intein/homing endonuclease
MKINLKLLKKLVNKCQKSPAYFINNFCHIEHPKAGIIPFKLFDYQKKSLKAFMEKRLNIYRKCRQCAREDSFVWTPNGPIRIDSIKKGDEVYSLDNNKSIVTSVVEEVYDNGLADNLVEIKSKTGHKSYFTGDHKFKTFGGWVDASRLTLNDRLVEVWDNERYGRAVSDSEAILLGYLLTDGHCGTKSISFSNSRWKYLLEFQKHFEIKFGKRLRLKKTKSGFPNDSGKNYRINSSLKACIAWIKNLGIAGLTGADRELPKEVFRWPNDKIALMLNRMFAADGWYSGSHCNEVGIGQISTKMLHQIKQLLSRFRISCAIYENKTSIPKLRIFGKDDFNSFVQLIGIFGKEPKLPLTKGFFFNRDKGILKSIKPIDSPARVYDLKVPPYDNYVVDGAVVHNCGISTLSGAFALWYAMFFPNKRILIVSKRDLDAKEFLKKNVKLLYRHLPDWMKEIWVANDNVHEMSFSNGSKIISLTSSKDTLRSNASSLNIVDEAAFMPHMDDMWAGGWPTLQHGGAVIVISTTYGVGNWYWRFWTDAETNQNDFNPIVINWWDMTWKIKYYDELAREHVVISPTQGIRKCRDATEIEKYGPYWSPWLEREYRNLTEKGNDSKFRQEVLAEFVGTGHTVLSRQTLNIIGNTVAQYGKDYQTVGEVDYVNPTTGEREKLDFREDLWVWKTPEKGGETTDPDGNQIVEEPHYYVLGGDTATGEGTDFSAIEVFDMNMGEQVAELKIKVRPKVLAKMIDYIGRYYNNALAVVENTGIGKATCQELYEDLAYPNVYRSRRKRADLKIKSGYLGFATTGQSKDLLDKSLVDGLGDGGYTIYSSRLHKEAMIYVQLTNNKTGAEPGPGNNDDLIIATALCLVAIPDAIRIAGHNLVPFHNIDVPLNVKSSAVTTGDHDKIIAAGGGRDLLLPMGISSELPTKKVNVQAEAQKFQQQLGGITIDSKAKNNIETVRFKRNKLEMPKKKRK